MTRRTFRIGKTRQRREYSTTHTDTGLTKAEAKKRAKRYRNGGYNYARVVKEGKEYSVYKHWRGIMHLFERR